MSEREPKTFAEWSLRREFLQKQHDETQRRLTPPPEPEPVTFVSPGPPIQLGHEDPGDREWKYDSSDTSIRDMIVAPLSVFVWPVLYAAPATAGFLAAGFTYGIAENLLDPRSGVAQAGLAVVAVGVGLVVLIPASRLDHRLARSWLWWAPRHALRLLLFAGLAVAAAGVLFSPRGARGAAAPDVLQWALWHPVGWVAGGIGALGAHWILTRPGFRARWHGWLETIGLRPKVRE